MRVHDIERAPVVPPQLPGKTKSPPALPDRHLHMVVLRANGASYWVVNTLLDSLSNETMLAIAKGLKPLTPAR